MQVFQIIIIILAAIILFTHGLQNFSKEIQAHSSEQLKKIIRKITKTKIGSFLLGALFTALIQSSSATSAITVALVDSGVLIFKNSLAILLGANIGTTFTTWIVLLNVSLIGPIFIVIGYLIAFVPTRISTAGKSIFYFGFIFFSLNLISNALEPIKNNQALINLLLIAEHPIIGILSGIIITSFVQSSSVVSGLVVILASQQILSIEAGIPIVIGSNIGTTSTALIASIRLSSIAKLAALSNFLFNFLGVLIVLPFIYHLEKLVRWIHPAPDMQVAFAHLIFNASIAFLFLFLLNPFLKIISKHRWYKENQSDI